MTKQVLLYEHAVPLSSEKHRDWSVKAGKDYSFAREVNAVPLTAVELVAAASEYPVVFVGKDENIVPLALLGNRQNQNLYVDETGAWTARYIPAFVRRYPFVFAATDPSQTQFTLCIDESFDGCNSEGRGEHLFDSEGERTQYLNSVLSFLREYEAHFKRTRVFCKKLQDLGLLEPMQARLGAPEDSKGGLAGFMGVNRQKLKEIDSDKLAELFRTDELELIYLHMFSLRNFRTMMELAGERSEAESVPSMSEVDTLEDEAAEGAEKPPVH
ncbi:MAG: SapC family protein [Gammaproteobacteria bacterium]|nr:SapC family protein [Gammaproteobacteria bacterium]